MKISFYSYPVGRLAMAGAIAAIEDKAYFEQTTKQIIATREKTTEELQSLGFHVLPSSANFVFVTHPNVDAKILYETLREENILIRYFGTTSIQQYVLMTIGTDEERTTLLEAIQRLRAQ